MKLRNQLFILACVVLVVLLAMQEMSKPGPGPVPPDPTPTPTGNLRVAFIVESSEKMPQEVIDEWSSADVRKYLNGHSAKENGQPAYRVFDKDTDVSHESAYWQKALATPPKSLPWLTIDPDGRLRKGYSGPPPKSVGEYKSLLEKYGGK